MDGTPLIEASRELRGRFYHLIDSLSALRALTGVETRYQTERQLLDNALDQLLAHESFAQATVHRFRDGVLEPAAARRCGAGGGHGDDPVAEAHGRLIADCAQLRRALRWDDCAREAAALGLPEMTGASVCAPILAHGELLGVLSVLEPRPNSIAPWQEHALHLFCNVLGAMLANNRLLNEMEGAVKSRTRQLEAALREAEQLKARYEQLSNVDEMTGLHNRRFFFPESEAVLARSVRYGHAFSLLLADIDEFKSINDSHGHAMGDQVIADIAEELRRQTRDGDIIARFGGEEFVIALPGTKLDGARLLASRIRSQVAALRWTTADGTPLEVTISLGVTALRLPDGREPRALLEGLLREADKALYLAKAEGRDNVRVFQPEARAPEAR